MFFFNPKQNSVSQGGPTPRAPALRKPGLSKHDGTVDGRIADIGARIAAMEQREAALGVMYNRLFEVVQLKK